MAEANRRGTILAVVRMGDLDLGAGPKGQEQGRFTPARPGEKPVEGDAGAKGKDLSLQLEQLRRELAAARATNEALKDRLERAAAEVKLLREAVEEKERQLRKLRPN